jgi:uncharacterized protein
MVIDTRGNPTVLASGSLHFFMGSYGGGRFLHVPLPAQGFTRVDFNESYNPPCAFNNFATCPLPPEQNKLALGVEAGEKAYGHGH